MGSDRRKIIRGCLSLATFIVVHQCMFEKKLLTLPKASIFLEYISTQEIRFWTKKYPLNIYFRTLFYCLDIF